MISSNDFKKGTAISKNNRIFWTTFFEHMKEITREVLLGVTEYKISLFLAYRTKSVSEANPPSRDIWSHDGTHSR